MKVQYELTKEDYISFNMHHLNNSKTGKQALLKQRFIVPMVYIFIPFILARITSISLLFWLLPFLILIVLWIAFYPRYFRSYTRKNIIKMLDEGKNEAMFGTVSLELKELGMVEDSKLGESKINWSSVEKIDETKDYIYIYISSINAIVIPMRTFSSIKEKNEFLSLIKSYCRK